MTTATVTPQHLLHEGTPAQIRDALVEEERDAFDREFRAALDVVARTLSLDALGDFLTAWRPRAAHQLHMGRDRWLAIQAEGERRLAGGAPPPGMVSMEEMQDRLQARLASGV